MEEAPRCRGVVELMTTGTGQSAARSSRERSCRPSVGAIVRTPSPRKSRASTTDVIAITESITGVGTPIRAARSARKDQRVADVLGQVAVVEFALGLDAEEAGRGAVGHRIVVLGHVALLDPDLGLGEDGDAECGGARQALEVNGLDQPPDRLGHALLVEQEVAARTLQQAPR